MQLESCKCSLYVGIQHPFLLVSQMPHFPLAAIFLCLTVEKWLPRVWFSVRMLLVASNKNTDIIWPTVKTFNMSWKSRGGWAAGEVGSAAQMSAIKVLSVSFILELSLYIYICASWSQAGCQ